jgi:hypothetical protein
MTDKKPPTINPHTGLPMRHAGEFSGKYDLPWMRCPCQGTFNVSTEKNCIVHSMPHCEKFERLEPDAFLRWARENGAHPIQ